MQDIREIVAVIREWMETFIMRSMRDMSRYVKTTGLSMPQFSLLMRLYYGGGCEVHDIGRQFEVSSAAASQLVERLVQSGLVARTENPDDRRARRIALSTKGRALIDRGIEERYRWVNELVAGLGAEERSGVLKSLPLLIEAEKKLPSIEIHHAARDAIHAARKRP